MWEAALPALISAGANIFGGFQSAAGAQVSNAQNLQIANMNAQLQRETNWQNRELYFDNRDWQEGMVNTAYQRQMKDMKEAGLNPILAYQKGGGAGSPQITAPTQQAPQLNARMENTEMEKGRAIGMAGTTALQSMLMKAELDNAHEQNKILGQDYIRKTHETDRASWDAVTAKVHSRMAGHQEDDYRKFGGGTMGQTRASIHRQFHTGLQTAKEIGTDMRAAYDRWQSRPPENPSMGVSP